MVSCAYTIKIRNKHIILKITFLDIIVQKVFRLEDIKEHVSGYGYNN